MRNISEVGKCTGMDPKSDTGATNKVLSDKDGLFYTNCWFKFYTIIRSHKNVIKPWHNNLLTHRLDVKMTMKDYILGNKDGKACGLV